MQKTILVVDDDTVLRNGIMRGLRDADFCAVGASSAEKASEILERINVDAIVLDRMMAGQDGLSFLKSLRKNGNFTPTIILTAMGGAENTIDGLDGGADDYMPKPFQLRELILRINNITTRNKKVERPMPNGLSSIDGEFFARQGDVSVQIPLSGEEKKLLQSLITPMGNIVSAQPMVAKRLRNKLNNVLSNLDIITIRGRGYKMICKDIEPPETPGGIK